MSESICKGQAVFYEEFIELLGHTILPITLQWFFMLKRNRIVIDGAASFVTIHSLFVKKIGKNNYI